jgi:hypothetical protein
LAVPLTPSVATGTPRRTRSRERSARRPVIARRGTPAHPPLRPRPDRRRRPGAHRRGGDAGALGQLPAAATAALHGDPRRSPSSRATAPAPSRQAAQARASAATTTQHWPPQRVDGGPFSG